MPKIWHDSCNIRRLEYTAVNFPLYISKIPVQISLYIYKKFRLKNKKYF